MRIKSTEKGPKGVTEYIAAAPPAARVMLKQLRAAIKAAAPAAEEKLSYGMPYYSLNGRLAYFAAFTKHVSVFIMGGVLKDFAKEVKPYWRGKATLQFPIGEEASAGADRPLGTRQTQTERTGLTSTCRQSEPSARAPQSRERLDSRRYDQGPHSPTRR